MTSSWWRMFNSQPIDNQYIFLYKDWTFPINKSYMEAAEKDKRHQINALALNQMEWGKFMEIMEFPVKINKNLKNAISKFNKMKK